MNIFDELINLDETLQIRIIFLLIIFVAIYAILRQMKMLQWSNSIKGIISLVIAIVAARSISETAIQNMGISSKFLGIFLIYIAIMLVITYLIHRKNTTSLIRKFLIILFAGSFAFVFYDQYYNLSEQGKLMNWILAGLTLLLIFFDNSIHKWVRYKKN
ncbi:hypothetical protein J4423_00420 [Candidatus Pacearchaeota archaeon]|nr:hypothetical protein [Candidatus Pacearchaeota archaeon]